MPAWGQEFGGPFTNEEASQLVAFIRSWEATAQEIEEDVITADPVRGATIFATTCFVCHGKNGQGTEITRALNDPSRLDDFDNAWYRSTISFGRPAKGMPTWGTVLSPQQLDDLTALIDAWRNGETVLSDIPLKTRLKSALFALRQFNITDALAHLNEGLSLADRNQAETIREVITLMEADKIVAAKNLLIVLLPPSEIGEELYVSYCAACHGTDGSGGLGTNLNDNLYIQSQEDTELLTFLLEGRSGTAMEGYKGLLMELQIEDIVAFLRTLQE
jgi:mono/diheme cytochrome c family protein